MKHQLLWLPGLFLFLLIFVACSKSQVSGVSDCNYSFFACPDGKVESSYVNHKALVKKLTGCNNLPAPYDQAFYAIELYPEGTTSLPSSRVLPCSDLPAEFQKDSTKILISGEQMSCGFFPYSDPLIKYAGNALFHVKGIHRQD